MNCPICGAEMEKGRIKIIQKGGSNLWGHSLAFYDEEDCEKSFIKKPFIRPSHEHSFSNFDTRNHMAEGYYCYDCRKIVTLLDEDLIDDL